MAQPDNFSLYQPLVAGALWLAARGLKGHAPLVRRSAGLLVGLATLARNDGLLVGAALGLVFVWDRWRAWRVGRRAAPRRSRLGGRRVLRPVPPRHGPVVGRAS